MLKPILLGRIELFNQGHIIKRTINPIATNSSSTSSEDGLEDAGFVLGGEQQQLSEESNTTKRAKKRTAAGRPQFGVRFGFRIHTPSERGGAVLVANKNLGFMKIKTEEEGLSASQRTSGRRTSMGLASLEGEAPADEGAPVIIREEDESDNLRVSDFEQGDDDQYQEDAEDDGDYLDASASQRRGGGSVDSTASKRKNLGTETQGRGKGKRAKATADEPPSQTDQKPTLQVSYEAMKLHPQTLYIVVRSLDSGLPSLSSILPFTTAVEPTSVTDKEVAATTATASTVQEDEESLFPPGLDYFIDS
ncbi:hypothetical protein BG015_011572 [Linnemannia schmuckeri]|uniref:Uncharacterized protein n=1 Tax=Linnemannia schmuckeri TaxID=64567 RepID=A0A9P5RSJ4_9FUNG|nr:hypothetical protein BG015_011572 [Linnemannia schmuckeri]